jgi:ABC-type amino acid transport substrate-binding protein
VSTRNIEPFSFIKNDQRTGYSIELWETIAKELGISNNYQIEGSAKQMIQAVETGKAEIAVGALSITSEREKVVDFSQPFFESGLQVLVRKNPGGASSVLTAISTNLLNWRVASGFGIALAVMFAVSHLVWKYEHPVNEEMWPRSYWEGMAESFWWTISIFLVGGADNKGPIGKGGRIVATLWMFASVIAVSLLTASLSAVLTVNALPGEINGPDDLYGRTIATVGGSVAEAWLTKQTSPSGEKIDIKTYPDVRQSIDALKTGKAKAVVYDAPILDYQIHRTKDDDIELVGPMFERANYGFAVKRESPLREQINQVMLKLNENGTIDQLRTKWFGARS